MEAFPAELAGWLDAVEAPVIAALFWMLHAFRRDFDQRVEHGDLRVSDGLQRTREELAGFKIEVARTYVPLSLIRDVDQRLSEQLRRIEDRLDELREDRR
ncbi:MAG: hypothetical protein K2X11_03680 [Acetobacteraceae bacterium]|nr:hypothetical protein [Acetobacteraceae bacterium]